MEISDLRLKMSLLRRRKFEGRVIKTLSLVFFLFIIIIKNLNNFLLVNLRPGWTHVEAECVYSHTRIFEIIILTKNFLS